MPCGLKDRPLKEVRNMGDEDNSGWPMAFKHVNDIMQVEAPSSTTMRKIFSVNDFVAYTTTI
jgi:hypothetical protein